MKMVVSVGTYKLKHVFWVWVWQIAKSFIVSESDSKFLNKSKKYEVLIGRKFFHFRASHWLFFYFHASEYCFPFDDFAIFWNIALIKIKRGKVFWVWSLQVWIFLSFATEMNLKARFSLIRFFGFCHFNISKIQIRILQAHQTNDFEILVRSEPITIVRIVLVVSTITLEITKSW